MRKVKATHTNWGTHGKFSYWITFKTLRSLKIRLRQNVKTFGPLVSLAADPNRFDELIKDINS